MSSWSSLEWIVCEDPSAFLCVRAMVVLSAELFIKYIIHRQSVNRSECKVEAYLFKAYQDEDRVLARLGKTDFHESYTSISQAKRACTTHYRQFLAEIESCILRRKVNNERN